MVGSPLGDLVGWWLALLLPALVVVGPLRRDGGVARAYLFTVILHIGAAVIYYYVRGILPTRGDSHTFSKLAVIWLSMPEWPSFGVGSQAFQWYITCVYHLFGPSFFLASILSIYAYAFSVIVLAKLMELLGVQRGRGLVVVLFGALPTAVLFGTVPLREAYQVLFFMSACYGVLRFRQTHQPFHLVIATASALLMGLLHKGLILIAPVIVLVMLFVRLDQAFSGSWTRGVWLPRLAAAALGIGLVYALSSSVLQEDLHGTDLLTAAKEGSIIEYTKEFRGDGEGKESARAHYGVTLDTSSPVHLVYSSFMILFYYIFTPFPWRVENYLDVYAFTEVVLRVVLLVGIFRMWRRGGPIHPQMVMLLMLVYLLLAFLWAAGTVNYGTAIRHHMVHQWILILLGVPALLGAAHRPMHGQVAPLKSEVVRSAWPDRARRLGVQGSGVRSLIGIPGRPAGLRTGRQPRRLQETGGPPILPRGLR